MARPPTLHAIIAYKLIKGPVQLVLMALLLLFSDRMTAELLRLLERHASEGWSMDLAHRVGSLAAERHVRIAALALGGDGVLTFCEGLMLMRGYWWAPWFVVATTGSLLPFEAIALVQRPSISHLLLLVVNLAIVLYLIHAARHDQVRIRSQPPGGPVPRG